MPVESSEKISGLNEAWPTGADPKSEGDNHLRLIKHVLKATFDDSVTDAMGLYGLLVGQLGSGVAGLQMEGSSIRLVEPYTPPTVPTKRLEIRYDTTVETATEGAGWLEIFDTAGTSVNKITVSQAGAVMAKGHLVITDGHATLGKSPLKILDTAILRTELAFDATKNTCLRAYDAAAVLIGEFCVRTKKAILRMGAALDGNAYIGFEDDADIVRARLTATNSTVNATVLQLATYNAASTLTAKLELSAAAGGTIDGSTIHTDANQSYTSGAPQTNMPVGAFVLANLATGAENPRNTNTSIKLGSSGYAYDQGGGGTQLAGTWRSRGTQAGTGAPVTLAQRIS